MEGLIEALPEELLQRVFSELPARSLAACQRVCLAWRRAASADVLWRDLTLLEHAWLTRRLPAETTWQQYHEQLSTSSLASFVVIGGRVGEILGSGTPRGIGRGRRWSVQAGAWADMPALEVERRGAALIRDDDGCMCACNQRSPCRWFLLALIA